MKNGISNLTALLCTLLHLTWGILQNLFGLVMFLIFVKEPHYRFRTSIVTIWNKTSSLGCGMFIFLSGTEYHGVCKADNQKLQYDVLVHEYGHCIQSLFLGPLFIPVIAIPSVSWAFFPCFEKLRRRKGLSYYWLYCEKWANRIGDRICKNKRILK